jgi:hypothetical protein
MPALNTRRARREPRRQPEPQRARGLALSFATVLVLCAGCAASSVERRRSDRAEAYAALPPEARARVDRGEIAQGLGTNAVFIAWGRPTGVAIADGAEGPELEWSYYRSYFKSNPVYYFRPDGRGYPTMDVYYNTTAWRYLARRVVFRDGRVAWFQTYVPMLP